MRISDWSSDVCFPIWATAPARMMNLCMVHLLHRGECKHHATRRSGEIFSTRQDRRYFLSAPGTSARPWPGDRKSVVKGQSVSVRVALGGSRISNKSTEKQERSRDRSDLRNHIQ